jgi:predicted DNA-binding protein (MmcQ/YjbR family)
MNRLRDQLRAFALDLPEAYEDFPWGEDDCVVKVNNKIFVFLGSQESEGMGVKLRESHEQALDVPGAAPSGYGLGRSGWVNVPLHGDVPPLPVMADWIEESYRTIAPKRLVTDLDRREPR